MRWMCAGILRCATRSFQGGRISAPLKDYPRSFSHLAFSAPRGALRNADLGWKLGQAIVQKRQIASPNRLIRVGFFKKKKRTKTRFLEGQPMRRGVVTKLMIVKPKKPNSAQRKMCKVMMNNGREVICGIPGEGHNLREHSAVIFRGGRVQDCPGVKYKVVRGLLDCQPVNGRKSSRSKYGAKALEAARRGASAVAIRGENVIVIGVEKKSTSKLQDPRTIRKIVELDEHIAMAFAGLTADARVLIDMVQRECQSHRLNLDDPVSIEYIARYVAGVQQRYTQSGGVRPFGISSLIVGFSSLGKPKIYQTDPSGTYHSWSAAAMGHNSKLMSDFLEKNFKEGMDAHEVIKLVIKSLLEVVQTGAKNLEIAVMHKNQKLKTLSSDELDSVTKEVEKEAIAENERKNKKSNINQGVISSS